VSNISNIATFNCKDEQALSRLAVLLAPLLQPPDCVLLNGDLGAGKTTFARALIRERASDATLRVPSPTFTLLQPYDFEDGSVHHYDLYRIEHPDELLEIGFEDSLERAITLVEWPQKAPNDMPPQSLEIVIEDCGGSTRRLLLNGHISWQTRLETMHG